MLRRATEATRRELLAVLGTVGSAGLAGCGGSGGEDGDSEEEPEPELPSPTAAFEVSPERVDRDEEVTVDASASEPPDGETIESYEWDFGDTGYVEGGVETMGSFSDSGEQTVRLRVTDSQGQTDVAEESVYVLPSIPSFRFNVWPTTPSVGQEIEFEAVAPIIPDEISIEEYAWSFSADGPFEATGPVVTHVFEERGEYTVRLRVTDSEGREQTTERVVEVLDLMPAVTFEYSPDEVDTATEVTFTADEPDLEAGISVSDYEWAFDAEGSFATTGQQVTHTFSDPGDRTVTLRVGDSVGRFRQTSRTVTVLPTREDLGEPQAVVESFVAHLDAGRTDEAYALLHSEGPADELASIDEATVETGNFRVAGQFTSETDERLRAVLSFPLALDDEQETVTYELRVENLEWRIWSYELP